MNLVSSVFFTAELPRALNAHAIGAPYLRKFRKPISKILIWLSVSKHVRSSVSTQGGLKAANYIYILKIFQVNYHPVFFVQKILD